MANPIDGAVLERDLNLAMAAGAVRAWGVHRPRSAHGERHRRRRYIITLPSGNVARWEPGTVEAFCLGVRLTLESLDESPGIAEEVIPPAEVLPPPIASGAVIDGGR